MMFGLESITGSLSGNNKQTIESHGEYSVPSVFECILMTDAPFYGQIEVTDIISGLELYSNMFDNQVCYGQLRLFDQLDNLDKYLGATSSYLYVELNDVTAMYKVISVSKDFTPINHKKVYDLYFVSIPGFYLLKNRDILPIDTVTVPVLSDMISTALSQDEFAYTLDVKSAQMDDFIRKNIDFKYYCTDTLGTCTVKQPKFSSRTEQIDFLCQYGIPVGRSDVTNTVNDLWCWQPRPDTVVVQSVTDLVKQAPMFSVEYGGLNENPLLTTSMKAEYFRVIKSPSTSSAQKNVTVTVDVLSRSTSFYSSDVNKIKNRTGGNMNRNSMETSGGNANQNVSVIVGRNSDVINSLDYMKDSDEVKGNLGLDSKRMQIRNDYFKSLFGYYAIISINRDAFDVCVGNMINLVIYHDSGSGSESPELDRDLSGKWLVIEKGVHINSNHQYNCVFGIIKDSSV